MLRIPGGVKKLIQLFFKLSGRIIKSHQPGGYRGVRRKSRSRHLPPCTDSNSAEIWDQTDSQIRPTPPCRSEEHTSELQSRGHLVCRLLLEKKKNRTDII